MKTIHIEQDDQGQITVAVDGGQPEPVQNAEDACQVVEAMLGQPDGDDMGAQQSAMDGAFAEKRGAGL